VAKKSLEILDPDFLEEIHDTLVCLICAILGHTLPPSWTGVYEDPLDSKVEVVMGKSFGISGRFVKYLGH